MNGGSCRGWMVVLVCEVGGCLELYTCFALDGMKEFCALVHFAVSGGHPTFRSHHGYKGSDWQVRAGEGEVPSKSHCSNDCSMCVSSRDLAEDGEAFRHCGVCGVEDGA